MERELEHLIRFAREHKLFDGESCVLISVSGGLDSMVLLKLMAELRARGEVSEVRCIHFNHGTRIENSDEEKLVGDYCDSLKIPFLLRRLNLDEGSNFEMRARDLRYQKLKDALLPGELLLLAHHIDDSFEWSLMEQMKSGGLKSSLGIPVVNGRIRRPLMAFTKAQLRFIAKKYSIPFLNDPSNKEVDFDRNYVRNIIIPGIKKRYPKYLKHYVFRSNILARELGMHAGKTASTEIRKLGDGCFSICNKDFSLDLSGCEHKVIDTVVELSRGKRGSLQKQVAKIVEGSKSGIRGPYLLSGDVWANTYPGVILLYNSRGRSFLSELETDMLNWLKKFDASEIPRVDLNQFNTNLLEVNGDVPLFMFSRSKDVNSIVKGGLKLDPLFPELSAYCKTKEIYFRPLFYFISHWKKRSKKSCEVFFYAKK